MGLAQGVDEQAPWWSSLIRSRSRHWGNRVAAAILLVISIGLLATGLGYGLHGEGDQVGAGFFPCLDAGALVILSVLWFIRGAGPVADAGPDAPRDIGEPESIEDLFESAVLPEVTSADRVQDEPGFDRAGVLRMVFVVAWSAVTLSFMNRLGVVVVMTVYLTGLLRFVAHRSALKSFVWSFVACALGAFGALRLGIVLPDPLHILALAGG